MEEDDFELVYKEIGRLEEEGVVMERNKMYSIAKSQIPDSVMGDRFIMSSQMKKRKKWRRIAASNKNTLNGKWAITTT